MLRSTRGLWLPSRILLSRSYASSPASTTVGTPATAGEEPMLSAEEEEAIYQENFRLAVKELKMHDYPKGTKVGRYVMGDYGLYRPRLRTRQEMYLEAAKKGLPSYLWAGKSDVIIYKAMMTAAAFALISVFYVLASINYKATPIQMFKEWRKGSSE